MSPAHCTVALKGYTPLCGWWGWRAAVSFYKPRALKKNWFQSLVQKNANEKHTQSVGGGWRSLGAVIHDG